MSAPASPAVPRDAATVILLRDEDDRLEVLLLRRPYSQKFMGGAWVFPGGKLDPRDGDGAPGLLRAAIRELHEEAGVMLDPAHLVLWARWITPPQEPVRFDARFFVARMPPDAEVKPDPREVVETAWLTPAEAVARAAGGDLKVMPPTLRNLELLSAHARVADVVAAAAAGEPVPVVPTFTVVDGVIVIALPGDPLHPDREPLVPGPTRIVLRGDGFRSEDPP
jgi:8-oxo-dGTP pyrophosphatase MutT (NUDIX family)